MIFNGFVRIFTGLTFSDTQCGFKAFVLEFLANRFRAAVALNVSGFDPEILFLAKRHGLRTAEVAVRWAHDPATKVHMLRDSAMMFFDLADIRWNWLVGRYPKRTREK